MDRPGHPQREADHGACQGVPGYGTEGRRTVKDVYWTVGPYDVVLVMEAPDEATITSPLLSLGALGNVHTQTLRGFSAEEMNRILAKMP